MTIMAEKTKTVFSYLPLHLDQTKLVLAGQSFAKPEKTVFKILIIASLLMINIAIWANNLAVIVIFELRMNVPTIVQTLMMGAHLFSNSPPLSPLPARGPAAVPSLAVLPSRAVMVIMLVPHRLWTPNNHPAFPQVLQGP